MDEYFNAYREMISLRGLLVLCMNEKPVIVKEFKLEQTLKRDNILCVLLDMPQ